MKPGIYPGLTMAEYLAIPAFSASLLKTMIDQCARAAWWESWMNPKPPPSTSDAVADAGSIAHGILLESSTANVQVIDPKDHPNEDNKGHAKGWTNKSIKAARAAAIAAGKIPIFPETMLEIEAMVAEGRAFIDSLRDSQPAVWAMFQPGGGESEVTIVWEEEGGILCKIRPDRISNDRRITVNYKTGGTSAEPDTWGRMQMIKMGYHVSAGFYRRGVKAACGVTPAHPFLVQEQEAPFLCSMVGIEPAGFELADRKVKRGLATWSSCLATGKWPGYPPDICYPEFPTWELAREEAHGIPYDPAKLWAKPAAAREDDPAYP